MHLQASSLQGLKESSSNLFVALSKQTWKQNMVVLFDKYKPTYDPSYVILRFIKYPMLSLREDSTKTETSPLSTSAWFSGETHFTVVLGFFSSWASRRFEFWAKPFRLHVICLFTGKPMDDKASGKLSYWLCPFVHSFRDFRAARRRSFALNFQPRGGRRWGGDL